jgi:uncharacterized membrane protein YedE/YeeE
MATTHDSAIRVAAPGTHDATPAPTAPRNDKTPRPAELATLLIVGTFFGIVLVKGEVVSWFRIQEMFHFQSFRMYGIMMSAIVTAMLSLALLRRTGARAFTGAPISIPPKELGRGLRFVLGGITFGIGWGLTGACPGPLFATFGAGVGVYAIVIASALVGTLAYGHLRPHLPH